MSAHSKKIDWLLDPKIAELSAEDIPTKDDFTDTWKRLNKEQKKVVAACIKCETLMDAMSEIPGTTAYKLCGMLDQRKNVMKAVIIGRALNMPSDVAKAVYIEMLRTNSTSRIHHRDQVMKLVMTDREHLQQLAKQIPANGDGKRQVLRELIAYGMQTKEHTPAVVSDADGQLLKPAVYTLADPRIALTAMQELNKMDHEYAEIATSTSSIESQAERIARLRESFESPQKMNGNLLAQVNRAANQQAKRLGGEAKQITQKDVE